MISRPAIEADFRKKPHRGRFVPACRASSDGHMRSPLCQNTAVTLTRHSNCPIYCCWRDQLESRFAHMNSPLVMLDCP